MQARAGCGASQRVSVSGRDLEFTPADFERVRRLIRLHAGIDLQAGKEDMVYSRLARRLRVLRKRRFREYLDAVQADAAGERQIFVNSLTTNLTAFYREPHHFDALAERLRMQPAGPPTRIWCCAASTGEEAYSIAMTAAEGCAAGGERVTVDASDIDTEVLEVARCGVYAMASVAGLTQDRLRRFFEKGTGANLGKVRVAAALRRRIAFRPLNLLAEHWDVEPYDVIFCRNVMIYFDRATQRRVLERLHACLRPGGWLVVGHSENFAEHADLFRLCGKTIYARVPEARHE